MTKYYNAMVVFEEIPDEITLAINITNCPCKCPGCHSKFLWSDVGTELTLEELDRLVNENKGITCICFMGGDSDPSYINYLCSYVINKIGLRTGWYSGIDEISDKIDLKNLNYIKIGHYDENLGPLNKKTTNQRLFMNHDGELTDITYRFWPNR